MLQGTKMTKNATPLVFDKWATRKHNTLQKRLEEKHACEQ